MSPYPLSARRAAAVLAVIALTTVAAQASADAYPITGPAAANPACAEPDTHQPFPRSAPGDVGMNPAAVGDALDFGVRAGGVALQIYRHGCLVGDRTPTGNLPLPLASASKGIAALVVGRAITLGYFHIDDPLVRFFPQADAAHAHLTVRQVLNQDTGLHFSWPADMAGLATGQVVQTLAEPADYPPGTTFQYAQNVLALLPKIIEITTGTDFQDFTQRELMTPLGIDRGNWIWLRDRSGATAVSGGLAMRPDDLARIGELLLREGNWHHHQLIDARYLTQLHTGTSANPDYGFLTWLNAADSFKGVEVPTAATFGHRPFPGSPADMYSFEGALGQFVTVIPSRDIVVIRLGIPLRINPADPVALLTGSGNPDTKRLYHLIANAVSDTPSEADIDPYALQDPPLPVHDLDDLAKLIDPATAAAIVLGVGPYASTDCNVLWCNGKPVPIDIFRLLLDASGQLAGAFLALGNATR